MTETSFGCDRALKLLETGSDADDAILTTMNNELFFDYDLSYRKQNLFPSNTLLQAYTINLDFTS